MFSKRDSRPGGFGIFRVPFLAILAVALFAIAAACEDDATTTPTATATGTASATATGTATTVPTATATTAPTGTATETATSAPTETATTAPTETATEPIGVDYGSLSGEIRIDGSSTVFPISEAVAEEFASVAGNVRVNVAFSGTGGGFEKFCRGEIEVADASRPISEDEIQACADAGISDVVEIRVATDALAVMVNPANTFAQCLTVQQLHDIFKEGGFTNWNQVDPSFPDAEIKIYAPGTDSGTFDYFVEAIVEGVDENAVHASDPNRVSFSEDDNVLALGIEGDENGIGYFGLAYYLEAGDALTAVGVDGGAGCVLPSEQTALDGTYAPLSRPLFVYTRASFVQERDEVHGFVNFYLEQATTLVPEVGYAPVPADVLAEQFTTLQAARDGTYVAPTPEPTTAPATIDYGSLSGEIRIDGSSTVFPISEAVAEEFASVAGNVRVNVAFSGTGGGFEKFCRGEIEVADASRPISEDEIQACADAGISDVVEIRVATDALAVMVNPANTFAQCLTVQQLHDIFKEGGFTNWNQVDPSFPDAEIKIYAPGTDSGTFDYFVEAIVEGVDENAVHASDPNRVSFSEDDNVLALGIEGDENGIGYFGLAYYLEAGDALTAVGVDGGAGCVLPSEQTALDGTYAPLSRPLFVYTRADFLANNPAVLGFVNFYLEQATTLVPEVGYAPVPADVLAEQFAKIAPYIQ